jgi:cob(I)alamin adenosyltransferase
MSPTEAMHRIDALLSHVWMVRTFLKHSEEAQDDEELQEVHRQLYDVMHALGPPWQSQDAPAYLRQTRKKLRRLKEAAALFAEIQPEVSGHTNFQMASRSLTAAVGEIAAAVESCDPA